jgi:hypothetical protein
VTSSTPFRAFIQVAAMAGALYYLPVERFASSKVMQAEIYIGVFFVMAVIFSAMNGALTLTNSGAPRGVTNRQVRRLLAAVADLPLPPELLSHPPRSAAAFEGNRLQAAALMNLLIHGDVARGVVVRCASQLDSEGVDGEYTYGWLDRAGKLRVVTRGESYDPMHAALGAGEGEVVAAVEAELEVGKPITIVYRGAIHVIYEATGVHASGPEGKA